MKPEMLTHILQNISLYFFQMYNELFITWQKNGTTYGTTIKVKLPQVTPLYRLLLLPHHKLASMGRTYYSIINSLYKHPWCVEHATCIMPAKAQNSTQALKQVLLITQPLSVQ